MTPERRVVLGLVRFELPRLLRRPSVVVGFLATGAAIWLSYRTTAPVLDRDSAGLVARFLPLAAGLLVAMHGVGSRPRRGKVGEILAAVPTRPAARVTGESFALVGPVIGGFVVLGAAMVFLLLGEPTGGWRWTELAAMPALLLLGGGIGLALGQWLPRSVSPIVTVIVLAYGQAWATSDAQSFTGRWLAGIAPVHLLQASEPYVWQARSPGAHLAWLLALAAFAAITAILRWDRRGTVVASGAVFAVVAVVAGGASLRAAQADAPFVEPELGVVVEQVETAAVEGDLFAVCEQRDALTFCALPGYEGWIPRWHETVTRITDLTPLSATRVDQRPWNIAFPSDGSDVIVTGMSWDRPGVSARETFELSAAVGLRSMIPAGAARDGCWLGGQAGGAVGLWLAVQGDEDLIDELRERVASARSGQSIQVEADGTERAIDFSPLWLGVSTLDLGVGVDDGEVALAMLTLPEPTIEEVVIAELDAWREPDASLADLAEALGLDAPEPPDEALVAEWWGGGTCR